MSRIVLLLSLVLSLGASAETLIRMSGSTTVSPIAEALVNAYRKSHTDTFYDIRESGCYKGVRDLGKKRVSIGLLARRLKKNEQKNYPDLSLRTIGYDGVALIVRSDNPIKNLSKGELRDIFMGRTKQWKAVGGKNAPIMLISEDFGRSGFEALLYYLDLDATTATIEGENHILFSKQRSDTRSKNPAVIAHGNREMIRMVAEEQDAIGYTSSVEAMKAIKAGMPLRIIELDGHFPSNENIMNNSYPLPRELNLVVREPMDPAVFDFVRFARSKEGRAVVESMGYPVKLGR